MRIDVFNQVNQVYGVNGSLKTNKTAKKSGSDKLEISSMGKDLQVAKQAVKDAPDVRMEKIADIKARMEQGTYYVSAEELADKLLAE